MSSDAYRCNDDECCLYGEYLLVVEVLLIAMLLIAMLWFENSDVVCMKRCMFTL